MNAKLCLRVRWLCLLRPVLCAGLAGAFWPLSVVANPPAPHNLVYGQVRDAYGTPLADPTAVVQLETPGGAVVLGQVSPGYAPGVNYYVQVPMDSGLGPHRYEPNALVASAQFTLGVIINNVTNLPIEMTGSFATLGQPAGSARIDLTLGVDANGDGIPDQWELAFLAALGLNLPLSAINANSILTNDGLTLRQEYLLGAYPFNPSQVCRITFLGFNGAMPRLSFPTVTSRDYTLLASTDLEHWAPVGFFLPGDDLTGPARAVFLAPSIATTEVYVQPPPTGSPAQFYRLLVQ